MDEDEKKSGNAGGWPTAVVILLVVYVLSIGPAERWKSNHAGPSDRFYKFYAPVWWAILNTPFAKPLDDYVGWWIQ